MSKAVKKKSRRLWRTVRKTLGTLFLVSALVIAAIPVDNLRAEGETDDIALQIDRKGDNVTIITGTENSSTLIPVIKPGEQIYTTADGKFQFAYVSAADSGASRIAVILGCAKGSVVGTDLTLKIPETVDAYKLYSISQGTSGGYVAAGHNGNALFYAKKTYYTKQDADGNTIYTNADGEEVSAPVENVSERKYYPCYASDINEWKDVPIDEFFYVEKEAEEPGTTTNPYIPTTSSTYQRIFDAEVWYIGNQYLESSSENINGINYTKWQIGESGNYINGTNPTQGVFATIGATTLEGSDKLHGIGSYAFYQCQRLSEFKACVNLREIGNGAFGGCANLQHITEIENANLSQIGKRAFADCTSLQSFVLPAATTTIGDSAFENCIMLKTVDLCSNGKEGALNKIGWDIFKNCEVLQKVVFPYSFTGSVDLSEFAGCTKLESVTARNPSLKFTAEEGYSIADFKSKVGDMFYFEGIENSMAHTFAKDNYFAFSFITSADGGYAKRDIYELTVPEKDEKGDPIAGLENQTTFRVNSQNDLIFCEVGKNVETLEFPAHIGPYGIKKITAERFMNQCNLVKVVIPSSVESIGDRAFRGCHHLENVIFASGNTVIGTDSFKTQDATTHLESCGDHEENGTVTDVQKTNLHFTTPVSSTSKPFLYAMSEAGRYNNTYQTPAYITCYSGLPQNLEIEYNPTTKMSELVDFPAISDLKVGSRYNDDKYSYLTKDDKKAIESAYNKYMSGEKMTEAESQILNATLNIVIPDGVKSIRSGLIKEKEDIDIDNNRLYPDGTLSKTVTAYSLVNIENGSKDEDGIYSGTFAGCEYLTGVHLLEVEGNSETTTIGDYAFLDCTRLNEVDMSKYVAKLGKVPFYGCEELGFVNFQDSPYYICTDKSLILGLDENRSPNSIIECLEGRESRLRDVTTAELGAGIKTLAPEAFRGSKVESVDLSDTSIETIPEGAFANTIELGAVTFPETLQLIENYAFAGSKVKDFYVKGKNTTCAPNAFYGNDEESIKRYGYAGLGVEKKTNPSDVMWYYAKDGVTSERTGKAQGFVTDATEFPSAYYVIFTYREEDGEFKDMPLEDRVASVDEAKLKYPVIPRRVTVRGMSYSFTDWDYVLENGDTWHFTAQYDFALHVITFMDSKDGLKEVCKMEIADGGNALRRAKDEEKLTAIMEDPKFLCWDCEGNLEEVTNSYTAVAKYRNEDEYIVYFYIKKGSFTSPYELLYTNPITVKKGLDAPNVSVPELPNYKFDRWDKSLTNIQEDTDFYAKYKYDPVSDGNNNPGDGNTGSGNGTGNPNGTDNPNGSGNGNGTNNPSGSGSGDGTNNPNGGNSGSDSNITRHTLQVRGGSGSGYYAAGEQIIITADEPARGQEFTSWTVSPADAVVTDKTVASFILTMPDKDVAVIANYRAKTSTNTGSGNSANTNSNRPNGTTGTTGGTTVVIDKNGLSNTGVVSATVNGSSDNFTIKITESSAATEAVLKALQAEYGSLDNLKYFPMDISLYDSTGTRKITDTTGLSVTITLPLPDSLITYAGNNKVAGVVNDRLDKLTPRFSTIDGVSCITFTAEHFSPYVIYVDITNLSDSTISDSTPKTGDGIHPKWFLSIGLACLSFVMFMMKDNRGGSRKKQKVAVKVRK